MGCFKEFPHELELACEVLMNGKKKHQVGLQDGLTQPKGAHHEDIKISILYGKVGCVMDKG